MKYIIIIGLISLIALGCSMPSYEDDNQFNDIYSGYELSSLIEWDEEDYGDLVSLTGPIYQGSYWEVEAEYSNGYIVYYWNDTGSDTPDYETLYVVY